MDEATAARMIERGEIDEEDIFYSIQEEIEIPAGCNDISSVLNDAKVLSDRLVILKQAHLRFSCFSKVSYNSGLDFERYYRELYEDIQTHHDLWFDKIFNVDNPNPTRAEFTTGILGTLCTILRQRGDLEGCMEVMQTYSAVLKRYQQMTEGCGRHAQIVCCEGLTYKANIIRINCGVQLRDKNMAARAFRDAVAFEKKEKALGRYDVDNAPDNDGVMEMFFGHNRYDEVSDEDIFKALSFMTDDRDSDGPPLELKKCGCCDKEESMHGDFKKCARCHEQPYCNKKCQSKDWKVHKHLCGKKNTTNLKSGDLLHVTKQLVKNHTATVEMRTGQPLTASQKDDAKLALVKKLKQMFTVEYKHYNSPTSAADASNDPAFCADLAKFFAKQPGYEEVWGELCVGYQEDLEMERHTRLNSNSLTVSDDHIRECCRNIARTLTVSVGLLLADGNTSEMCDLQRHNKLVDGLVDFVKLFVRGHREYDSHAGLRNLASNEEFKAQMADVISNVMEIEVGE